MRSLTFAATAAFALATGPVLAETTLKMATIAPSLGQAITMATFANVVNDHLEDIEIEVALDDLEGTTVFLGPAGGGAFNAAKGWIEATTGLVAGEDYEAITANWATGFQSFLDGKIDMYVNGCLDPCQQFIQFTETEDVRFIGPEAWEGEAVTKFLGNFRYLAEVPAGQYKGQVNEGPVMSNDTAVGIGVRADLDEETSYQVTRAVWENIGSISTDAPWARALDIDYAVQSLADMPLHPGAERYYREVGALK